MQKGLAPDLFEQGCACPGHFIRTGIRSPAEVAFEKDPGEEAVNTTVIEFHGQGTPLLLKIQEWGHCDLNAGQKTPSLLGWPGYPMAPLLWYL